MKTAAAVMLSAAIAAAAAGTAQAAIGPEHPFAALAFGQSTDLNFATNVLPEKVGVNNVYAEDGTVLDNTPKPIAFPFKIESRGGKIANSHDGLVFYYTELPADKNFVLEAVVRIDQFGPENGAKPAAQEGCGLLVRDILGKGRADPVMPGIEEFPAASNMVMTAVMTHNKKDHEHVKIVQMDRNGIDKPYGNPGSLILRTDVADGLDLTQADTFKLRLERTDGGFISAYAPLDSDQWVQKEAVGADRLTVIDPDHYYVGFFSSRNAAMTVLDATLQVSDANTKAVGFEYAPEPLYVQPASSELFTDGDKYAFKLRANQDGTLVVTHNGSEQLKQDLKAGEFLQLPIKVAEGDQIGWSFTSKLGQSSDGVLTLKHKQVADPMHIYAAPQADANDDGTLQHPTDAASALALVQDGGVVELLDGDYPLTEIPASASGSEGALKTVKGSGNAVFHGLDLDASYIELTGVVVTEHPLNLSGSHNYLHQVVAHHCDDTGIWLATPADRGRALWAAYNLVEDCISYENQDPGNINADGIAVKMRVGDGNRVVRCLSFGNADDGYDLFNKIEDGPNGAVEIIDSIAAFNQNNGFKMGGEGLPVAHKVIGGTSYRNGMDGYTDNFNPGAITVTDNLSIDSKRFNFLFRQGPFVKEGDKVAQFEGDYSLRTTEGVYPDVVNGEIGPDNVFLDSTSPNSEGFDIVERTLDELKADSTKMKIDRSYFVTRKEN